MWEAAVSGRWTDVGQSWEGVEGSQGSDASANRARGAAGCLLRMQTPSTRAEEAGQSVTWKQLSLSPHFHGHECSDVMSREVTA